MNLDRVRRWRWLGWSIGALLLVIAAGMLALTVDVHAGGEAVSCGSAWDVVAGRSGWQQWWAMDQADPVAGAPRLRTDGCVGAVNGHIVAAAVLAAGAVAALTVAALLGRSPTGAPRGPSARRLRTLGTVVTWLGVGLSAGGFAGIVLLVADPSASLFLYVDRPVVVLLGLLLLMPAVLLVVLGSGARVLADHLALGIDDPGIDDTGIDDPGIDETGIDETGIDDTGRRHGDRR